MDDEQTVRGVSNRIINSTVHGDVYQAANLTVHQRAVRRPAAWPHLVGRIPPQAGCFQVRGESERLARALDQGGNTVVVAPAAGVVLGLGGVGKTQLAAHYARTLWHGGELDVLVWIAAASTTEVVAGFASAAAELLGTEASDAEQAARQFLAWLEPGPGRPPCRWLVVLDDVSDPADLTGLWPPASPQGRTLLTSRRRDAALTMGRRIVPLGVFTPVDSQVYLTEALAAADRQEADTELAALAEDLGHLPLALSQAAAYLIDTGLPCRRYRALLADRARTLAEAAPDRLPDDQPHTVAAAWDLSIERADSLHPPGLARPVLELAAFLSPTGIPEAVFDSPPVLAHLSAGRFLEPESEREGAAETRHPVSAEHARLALRALHRLSLIDHLPDSPLDSVRIHQLVQHAVRDTLTVPGFARTAQVAAQALTAVWPDEDHSDRDLAAVLRANTATLDERAEDQLWDGQDGMPSVLSRSGHSLVEAGLNRAAAHHWTRFTSTAERRLGADHEATIVARMNLAVALRQAGEFADAVAIGCRADADSERVLGGTHETTLLARGNLISTYRRAGLLREAVDLGERTVADCERVLGSGHRATLVARGNLASACTELGLVDRGIALRERTLADRDRDLGTDHPTTVTTRSNLALDYIEAGRLDEGIALGQRALADRERILGPDHPDTLTTRGNVALGLSRTGRIDEAIALGKEVLADRERVIGADHPDTLATRGNLACSYRDAGRLAEAIVLGQRVLADCQRVLGNDHPDTLRAGGNLVASYRNAGFLANAIALGRRTLADHERALGARHPRTISTRHDLAAACGQAGRPEEAVILGRQVLASREQLLGSDHPDTLLSRGSLAAFHFQSGQLDDAIALGTQAAADYESLHGSDHPLTLATRCNLGSFHHYAGHYDEAVSLTAGVVEVRARLLPSDDEELVATRVSLAAVLTARGRALLPEDTAGAWRDAGSAVQTVGPYLADAPTAYGPVLAAAYRLAADALDADGQPQAAARYRGRRGGAPRGPP
ncbi:FxSxx-COOH system tetratricopeptide repeat protein, partial [Kitasatospora sp. NPDC059088]|uniref:FxSxx-COOH system tetratricopeptide repeat protein n=1 Tax=Kitasatospora sp. NPDC059088 TaxID=3346722 RepID=UPI00367F431F